MPNYEIRCKNCGFGQDLILTSYADYERIVSVMPCEKCSKCDWEKMPTTANIPKSGTYSFEDKK